MTTLYLTEPGTVVRYRNESLIVTKKQDSQNCRLAELDLVIVLPGVQLTDVAIAQLIDRGIETIFLRQSGQFRGRLQGQFATNPAVRMAQYRILESALGMALAQKLVIGKIRNQRVLLQRRNRATERQIAELIEAINLISVYSSQLGDDNTFLNRSELMGVEGICARTYYQGLRYWFPAHWNFNGRNRRPPLDPVNALMSWGYGVLLARVFSSCVQAGLDPYLGFFHATEPYRPNLVLDLMEEFRPVIVDQAVISIIQSEMLTPDDFQASPDGEGIWLGNLAKKLFLAELDKQFRNTILYPPQNRRLTMSSIILEQARSLGRCLTELNLNYEAFTIK
ncbi:CRISPR-associated endonuclease Cas1 [Dulcicalothrix desertica PCC 7102]|uniref:CRISPR-associated endonuclease Cas1 n=1 Tax=Dulcicalothrix desertica PCC 7102 TaxID=232991 RepID=A0A3S1CIR3_9CYAN|nr:CRISPR-associated endonuclease Cas1 [Dulcicalothrix desertica]RUT02261.1 CRISPR-associated endonuclease Cas1 [Dulcicalothrix desertica PCC 7102]TWH53899.1 CRISPR-associated Cas1 family protein [Dulcicalothrix desertica PCC 7102]